MCRNRLRIAFTLIEVLIVVIIMAVLAATVIPQFSSSTRDAKDSSLDFNLRTIQSQIETYTIHHLGDWPSFADFETQMTEATNVDGGTTGDTPYGPYMRELPSNPFSGSSVIVAVAVAGTDPAAVVAGGAGWQYDETTGGFFANNSEAYE